MARVTQYTADSRGYRARQVIRSLEEEEEEQEQLEGEVAIYNEYDSPVFLFQNPSCNPIVADLLIVGPIPPFLRRKNENIL